ncbi:MAG: Na(+)/H(+) antiporter [Labilithrix sp.]|nr:Na(+)/H(+) antiporter [Labilithrix sp.]
MSAIALLMGLLLLSYVGSLLVGGRSAKGLPSGIEFIALGFIVGPTALGLVDRAMIQEFSPIVQTALGWLAFVVGLDFGRVNGRRVRQTPMFLGIFGALLTGLVVAGAVYFLLRRLPVAGLEGRNAALFAAAAGAVTAETTRFVVQWVSVRWHVKGPVSSLLVDIAAADDLTPLVATGAIFAFAPAAHVAFVLPVAGWFGLSLLLGALLGTVTALLLRHAEGYAVWGALIGTLMLGVGAATRLGLCTIFVTFVMGVALGAVSPNRRPLRKLVGSSERAVLYPMLLLAGVHLDPAPLLEDKRLVAVLAFVLLARIAGKLLMGLLVQTVAPAARPAGPLLGIVLLSSGPVSVSCGFVLALRFPGRFGDTLLAAAVASALLGEIVATFAVKSMLTDLGELTPIEPVTVEAPRVPSVPPAPGSDHALAGHHADSPSQPLLVAASVAPEDRS